MSQGKSITRLGMTAMVSVCRIIQSKKGISAMELAERIGCASPTPMRRALLKLKSAKIVHVSGWLKSKGPWMALYAWGDGEDAPYPGEQRPEQQKNHARMNSEGVIAFISVLRVLQSGPATIRRLCEETGVSRQSIDPALSLARKIGFARIADWEVSTEHYGPPAPMWGLGNQPNRRRPEPIPAKELRRLKHLRTYKSKKALVEIQQHGGFSVFNVAAIAQASNYQEAA